MAQGAVLGWSQLLSFYIAEIWQGLIVVSCYYLFIVLVVIMRIFAVIALN
jgi:hypothetical protein